jgi:putative membrane protein
MAGRKYFKSTCPHEHPHPWANWETGRKGPLGTSPQDRGTVLAEERTDLAVERTRIAAERTLMAWIRTANSMIGFGFTIYKFFQYLPEEIAAGNIQRPYAPRNLGLTLIGLGTLALAAATWQHWSFLKALGASSMHRGRSISFVIAICIVLIGCITFYGVLLKKGPF